MIYQLKFHGLNGNPDSRGVYSVWEYDAVKPKMTKESFYLGCRFIYRKEKVKAAYHVGKKLGKKVRILHNHDKFLVETV